MPNLPTNKLYAAIGFEAARNDIYLKSALTLNFEELFRDADIMENASTNPNKYFSCIMSAIKNQSPLARRILKYYKDNNRVIDFSQEITLPQNSNYTLNLLQYAFKYGSAEIFEQCCQFIGDSKTIKDLLNKPTSFIPNSTMGTMHTGSIWEDSAASVSLAKLISEAKNSLSNDYDKATKRFLIKFLDSWGRYSASNSSFKNPVMAEEWKKYVEEHNTNYPNDQLAIDNPALEKPIEFIINPLHQFGIILSKKAIDFDYLNPSLNLTFPELVDFLSYPEKLSQHTWDNIVKPLFLKYSKNLSDAKFSATEEGSILIEAKLRNNDNTNEGTLQPIQIKVSINMRSLNNTIAKMVEGMVEEEKANAGLGRKESIEKLKATVQTLNEDFKNTVEGRRKACHDAFNEAYHEHAGTAENFFSEICNSAITHVQARQLAADGLFKVNVVTTAGKSALAMTDTLHALASAFPGNGASILTGMTRIATNYVTTMHAEKQSKGVTHVAAQINLPLLLVDLSEAITNMVMLMAQEMDESDQRSVFGGRHSLSETIKKAINTELDKLYAMKDRPNETELKQLLFVTAAKAIDKHMTKSKAHGKAILSSPIAQGLSKNDRRPSGGSDGSGYGTDNSKGSKKSKDSRLSKGSGGGCNIS